MEKIKDYCKIQGIRVHFKRVRPHGSTAQVTDFILWLYVTTWPSSVGDVGSTLRLQRGTLASLSAPKVLSFKVRNQLWGQIIVIWKKC